MLFGGLKFVTGDIKTRYKGSCMKRNTCIDEKGEAEAIGSLQSRGNT